MAQKFDVYVLEMIRTEFNEGFRPLVVLKHLQGIGISMSRRYIYLLYNRWRESGYMQAQLDPRGRPRSLSLFMLQELAEWLEYYTQSTILDMADFLWDRYEISPSRTTIWRGLKALRLSRKQIRPVAAERNEELREDWKRRIAQYDPKQLIFLDESACSEKASRCRTAWSLFGIAPEVQRKLHCRQRFSILPAYTLEGYIAYRVIPGSYNRERFNDFVRECVLPLCTRDYSVICLDNVRTHRNEEFLALCEAAGVRVEYLSPYSPDFNPIELSFAHLKGWMRRHQALAEEYARSGRFSEFIELAIREFQGTTDMEGPWRHVGLI